MRAIAPGLPTRSMAAEFGPTPYTRYAWWVDAVGPRAALLSPHELRAAVLDYEKTRARRLEWIGAPWEVW